MSHTQSWDTLYRRAKLLESRLETKVQRYSSLAQRINADFLCDEEGGHALENREEQDLAVEIDRDLQELTECINNMRNCSSSSVSSSHREGLIKRYQEIHFDYSTEFKHTSSTVLRKRESVEKFQSSSNLSGEQDSSVAKLLRERSSIAQSMRSINDVINQAFETKNSLAGQRHTLGGAAGGLKGLVGKFT